MRKLKLQVQITIDGYIAGPEGQLDWMTWNWSDDIKKYVDELTNPVDRILLGRNMTDGFINHWKNVKADKENPEHLAGVKFTDTPKTVFSEKLNESKWDNTVIAKGSLKEEVNRLKAEEGTYLMVYGGAGFVSSLVIEDLIDDYYLFVNPSVLGKGKRIFDGLNAAKQLNLIESVKFECGIVVNHYQK